MKRSNCFKTVLGVTALVGLTLFGFFRQSCAQCPTYGGNCLNTNGNPCDGDDNGSGRLLQTYGTNGYCWTWDCISTPAPLPGIFIGISTAACQTDFCATCYEADTTAKFFHIRNLTGCGPVSECGAGAPTGEIIDSVDIIGTPTRSLLDSTFPIFRVCEPWTNRGVNQAVGWDFSPQWNVRSVWRGPSCTELIKFHDPTICDTATSYFCGGDPNTQKHFRVRLVPGTPPVGNVALADLSVHPMQHLTFVLRGMDQIEGIIIYYRDRTGMGTTNIGHLFTGLSVDNQRIPSGHCWDCTSPHSCTNPFPTCDDSMFGPASY